MLLVLSQILLVDGKSPHMLVPGVGSLPELPLSRHQTSVLMESAIILRVILYDYTFNFVTNLGSIISYGTTQKMVLTSNSLCCCVITNFV